VQDHVTRVTARGDSLLVFVRALETGGVIQDYEFSYIVCHGVLTQPRMLGYTGWPRPAGVRPLKSAQALMPPRHCAIGAGRQATAPGPPGPDAAFHRHPALEVAYVTLAKRSLAAMANATVPCSGTRHVPYLTDLPNLPWESPAPTGSFASVG
jgi:hypothetical protein